MSNQYPASPEAYRRIFEDSREGSAILEDLIRRFSHVQSGSGIDRILNMTEQKGRRDVLDYIVSQINRANGVHDASENPSDPDE